ncbi:MAG: polyprenyl synthetase family protein [Syntrophomonadaceae bacterium]|jgi:geranylgeranyl diphosphate synthase type II|nr:polyprenyl synthetase family protein [Syntrophomonadaceae bacterium]
MKSYGLKRIPWELDMEAFKKDLKTKAGLINKYLKRYLPAEQAFPPSLHKAIHYSVFNGGKRLRPILVLESARLAGLKQELAAPFACALEFIHTYSLVHDDLPAMDDDDLRRGRPTCHIVYGEALAVLTGDALLTRAFQIMSMYGGAAGLNITETLRVISEIAAAAGSSGMVAGQTLDLEAEGRVIDGEELRIMHNLKTGCLFRAALRSGAILGGMPKGKLSSLSSYAKNFGLAFQITDDILDVEGEQEKIGKPLGSDAQNNKCTYVSLWGLPKAREIAGDCVDKCLSSLKDFGPEADFLRNLAFYLPLRSG